MSFRVVKTLFLIILALGISAFAFLVFKDVPVQQEEMVINVPVSKASE